MNDNKKYKVFENGILQGIIFLYEMDKDKNVPVLSVYCSYPDCNGIRVLCNLIRRDAFRRRNGFNLSKIQEVLNYALDRTDIPYVLIVTSDISIVEKILPMYTPFKKEMKGVFIGTLENLLDFSERVAKKQREVEEIFRKHINLFYEKNVLDNNILRCINKCTMKYLDNLLSNDFYETFKPYTLADKNFL